MKLSDMFIGQIVMIEKPQYQIPPEVGYVIDLALQYETRTILSCSSSSEPISILPVIKFVAEDIPRKVLPANLVPYKETKR